jgi:hypothetical protein
MFASARARMGAGMSETDDDWDAEYGGGVLGKGKLSGQTPPRVGK